MHNQTRWQDRVTEFEDRYRETNNPDGSVTHTPVDGEVIQEGTPQNQTNFNNIEHGIQDATIALQVLAVAMYRDQLRDNAHQELMDSEVLGEVHEITLKNTLTPPFNSSIDAPTSVALTKARKNLYYSVETEVKSHKGVVGEIVISDKALNGFKIAYTGSASEVTLTVRIKGGMT